MPHGTWNLISLIKSRTCVPCTGRQILNHWTASEVSPLHFNSPGYNCFHNTKSLHFKHCLHFLTSLRSLICEKWRTSTFNARQKYTVTPQTLHFSGPQEKNTEDRMAWLGCLTRFQLLALFSFKPYGTQGTASCLLCFPFLQTCWPPSSHLIYWRLLLMNSLFTPSLSFLLCKVRAHRMTDPHPDTLLFECLLTAHLSLHAEAAPTGSATTRNLLLLEHPCQKAILFLHQLKRT